MKSTVFIRDWPLLCLVAVLFILSVRAPRDWRRVAIAPLDQRAADVVEEHGDIRLADLGLKETPKPLVAGDGDVAGVPVTVRDDDEVLAPRRLATERTESHEPQATRAVPSSVRTGDGNAAFQEAPRNLVDEAAILQEDVLGQLAVNPRMAQIDAAVANRFAPSESLETVAPPLDDLGGDELAPPPAIGRIAARNFGPDLPSTSQRLVRSGDSDSSREPISSWPRCRALIERLEELKQVSPGDPWCEDVRAELEAISRFDTLSADAVALTLDNLQRLAAEGRSRLAEMKIISQRNQWGRCLHGLERRLQIWSDIHGIAAARSIPVAISLSDSIQLMPALESLETRLRDVKYGDRWREYLLVDQARQLVDPGADLDTAASRQLARRILRRMEYSQLTPAQRDLLGQPPFQQYSHELKHLAADPVDYFQLLQDLEDYEVQPTAECSARIAAAQQALRWSHDEAVVDLGRKLDGRYRNANLRLAVSQDLINRWMPPAEPAQMPVDETILGIRTRGCSETVTKLKVRMLPSPYAWRLYLQADGAVASETFASQGPAKFYTRGLSKFQAEKQIIIQAEGIRQPSAEVVAESNTNLAGLETDIDAVPIVGDIVQAIAAYQYQLRAREAEWEAENRLAWRIGEMIDERVSQQVERMERRFVEHFQQPTQKLGLNPLPLEMQTTDRRVIARYRLAGHHQLAAYTPRPLAPGNSLLSLQIHESALNNMIEQFAWSGRRVKLRDIYKELGDLFAAKELEAPEDVPEDVTVRFADRNPVRLAFQDGRVTLTLGLSELSQGRKRWRNFVVRVHYQPALDNPQADLVRDQYVELIGRLAFGDQIALRGVFSRVFSRDKPIDLVSRLMGEEPRLHDLEISQLEIDDGWLALAIGPRGTRLALQSREESHASDNLLVR